MSGAAGGNWTLSGPNSGRSEFADFNAALRNARERPGSKSATIEIWQGGEYICCLPPQEWPAGDLAPDSAAPRFAAVDLRANHVARFMMPVVGAVFWLALLAFALAASLGWRLALL